MWAKKLIDKKRFLAAYEFRTRLEKIPGVWHFVDWRRMSFCSACPM
jgi:hypothetical protein